MLEMSRKYLKINIHRDSTILFPLFINIHIHFVAIMDNIFRYTIVFTFYVRLFNGFAIYNNMNI